MEIFVCLWEKTVLFLLLPIKTHIMMLESKSHIISAQQKSPDLRTQDFFAKNLFFLGQEHHHSEYDMTDTDYIACWRMKVFHTQH